MIKESQEGGISQERGGDTVSSHSVMSCIDWDAVEKLIADVS